MICRTKAGGHWAGVLLPAIVLAAMLSVNPAIAQRYTVVDLGSLYGKDSFGIGLNNLGWVVGFAYDAQDAERAILFHNGVMTDLGTLGGPGSVANGVNDLGQVVGGADVGPPVQSSSPPRHAFVWEDGVMHDLGTLGVDPSVASGINARGQVAGWSLAPTFPFDSTRAFLRDGEPMRALDFTHSYANLAYAVNDAGWVVGQAAFDLPPADSPPEAYRAVLYTGREVQDLGSFGGKQSSATDINSVGRIVGWAETDQNDSHAFLFDGQLHDLGTLGGPASSAAGINDWGQIVGVADAAAGDRRVVLWFEGETFDLNELLMDSSVGRLVNAGAINELGQIAGTLLRDGQYHAALVSPLWGDMNGDASVNNLDIGPFAQALTLREIYVAEHPTIIPEQFGDVNRDRALNNLDIVAFSALLTALPAETVPEPSCWLLAVLAIVLTYRIRLNRTAVLAPLDGF